MTDKHPNKTVKKEAENQREEMKKHADKVDVAEDDSFPASDPPSYSPVKGQVRDRKPLKEVAEQSDK
jgi:hypothetical protein